MRDVLATGLARNRSSRQEEEDGYYCTWYVAQQLDRHNEIGTRAFQLGYFDYELALLQYIFLRQVFFIFLYKNSTGENRTSDK